MIESRHLASNVTSCPRATAAGCQPWTAVSGGAVMRGVLLNVSKDACVTEDGICCCWVVCIL
jgi:hypothetical protein